MNTDATNPGKSAAILRLLKGASVTAFSQDTELRYRWIENPPKTWSASDPAGKSEIDILPAKAAAIANTLKREVLRSGRAQWTDLTVERPADETEYFDLYLDPDRDSSGTIIGLFGLAIDITDRRKQAETMDAVAKELSHRTKNLLAVIQSLGTQTARSSDSTEDFIETFRGRIQSISRSQDLSIEATRHGAKLSDLVRTQVHPYVADIDRQFEFYGTDRYLTANSALHVGLALYELCISAVKSGALSTPGGKVRFAAEIVEGSDDGTRRNLDITWCESNGPTSPPFEGFSKALLERVVPAAVGGRATLTDVAPGRCYALSIAQSEFD